MSFFNRFRNRNEPTESEFAQLLIGALKEAGDTRSWVYEAENQRLVQSDVLPNSAPGIVNLVNMFADYLLRKPDQRLDVLQRQAQAVLPWSLPTTFDEAKDRLRPIVRSTTERGVLSLQMAELGKTPQEPAFKHLCENLELGLAYDGSVNILRLTEDHLTQWGMAFDDVLDVALDNLRLESNKPWLQLRDGVYLSQYGDYYDAARILLPDVLHRIPFSGAPVVMAPNRTALLLTGDRNPAGLQTMVELAEQARAQPRPLPALMLKWNGSQWERFVPKGLEERLSLLRIQELAADYGDQQKLLENVHQKQALDIFIAEYTGVKRDAGGVLTYSVWTEGVHTLLPVTDFTVLYRPSSNERACVPTPELLRECSESIAWTEHLPTRFEVVAFPADKFEVLQTRFPTF
ncbi:hypothetical protein PPN31114_01689 [Pandoraea pneumonica]|jgi:uncharacterized protein YtpQ (UPF0354 family)|uniref:DUF1444 family protein n=1 Tax=Pandoraea pneumonica TaxID=2508299 RepID=A0A5E4TWM0_9BURK|nr:hypothetical protein [Pandoraea pneumonica]VVD91573.1 hypothetical protein PPN31114_01689 [Pandoraea pneumonica]